MDMCVAQSRVCHRYEFMEAPKRISMTVRRGVDSKSERTREYMAGCRKVTRRMSAWPIKEVHVAQIF